MNGLTRTASILALLVAGACATIDIQPWPEGQDAAAARFEQDLTTLASDAYQGREAGTAGHERAVDYVVAQFEEMGLQPAGTDGFLQQVPLRRATRVTEGQSAVYSAPGGAERTLAVLDDFLLDAPSAPDASARTAEAMARGDIVFAGYGIDAPAFDIESYDGVDVRGKVVLLLQGVPEGLPSEERAHFQSARTKIETAAAKGAAAVLFLGTQEPTLEWRENVARWAESESDTYAGRNAAREGVVTGYLFRDAARELFEAAGTTYEAAATPTASGAIEAMALPGELALTAEGTFENYTSPNVVAMIEGSDPDLKNEYVVLSAHLDHVGVHGEGEDTIHNGAMDNASGIATMLEAARRFQADGTRPRRSILFVAVTAEEKGLLGSDYFASNPTVPAEQMVANVNLDMPILLHDFTDVIAFGAQHSTMQDLVEDAAESMNVALTPDPVPEMVLFVRSDHYSFVKQGVPSVFLFLGFANGGGEKFQEFMTTYYHQPSDQPDLPIQYDTGAKFAALNYRIAKAIANADERPQWNPGDFFGGLYGPSSGS
ncbi:M20/M25/M40 family metallo-hydrolase [Parvularcula oceani]|uniref:M20/M25/M40 family metallo-hydrolase n=1 Tax=Parvularcula oceani TaxID=1247963 RepID=UPI0004E0B730|nr:M20/M25/M40 family metallo-hydrolase [Parvularcula oceani]